MNQVFNPITGEEIKTHQFALRFTTQEQERYEEMVRRAYERNQLARLSDINRELLGMRDSGLFTKEDLAYFRGTAEATPLTLNVPRTSSLRPKEAKPNVAASKKRKTK